VEKVDVTGWGGARTDVTISIPGQKDTKLSTKMMDAVGNVHFKVRVGAATGPSSKATIRIRCRLGPFQGIATTAFLILRQSSLAFFRGAFGAAETRQ
jgi:hypothetical protein